MTKPNFFVLGAPKCGTTSLVSWLSQHPSVFMSPEKEPHHFNTDMAHRQYPKRDSYERLFAGANNQHIAVGEASVWYLYSQDAVMNIEAYADNPRYIVCLRNPAEMAYALHEQQVFSGNEDCLDFESAWRMADRRRAGDDIPRHATDPTTLIYPDACALGRQLQRLLGTVEAGRVHIVWLDMLSLQPRTEFEQVQTFLRLKPDADIRLHAMNLSKQRRSAALVMVMQMLGRVKSQLGMTRSLGMLRWMDAVNRKPNQREPLDEAFAKELTAHFRDEVRLLEDLTNRDLSDWK